MLVSKPHCTKYVPIFFRKMTTSFVVNVFGSSRSLSPPDFSSHAEMAQRDRARNHQRNPPQPIGRDCGVGYSSTNCRTNSDKSAMPKPGHRTKQKRGPNASPTVSGTWGRASGETRAGSQNEIVPVSLTASRCFPRPARVCHAHCPVFLGLLNELFQSLDLKIFFSESSWAF
jgi:hypothetical protein